MSADTPAASWIKPVVTFDEEALARAMRVLWAKVEDQYVSPDCIVGIAAGGLRCAQKLQSTVHVPIFSCALHRPGTRVKQRNAVKGALGSLPYRVSNWMRRIEDRILMMRAKKAQKDDLPATAQLVFDVSAIAKQVLEKDIHHLVIIDDAVDSGMTLVRVVNALRAALPPDRRLTTAVIAQTRSNVALQPDVLLYRNTLCRFPWSFDFRGN